MTRRRKFSGRMNSTWVIAALLSTFSSPSIFAAPFQNGSFETFNAAGADVLCSAGINFCGQYNAGNDGITGWTIGGSNVDVVGPLGWTASDGSRSIDLNGVGPGSLSQTFDTVAGTSYVVTFDIGGNFYRTPTPKTGTVSAASSSLSVSFDDASSSVSNMGWISKTFGFVATSSSTTLIFASTITVGAAGLALDNVSVAAAVPEPEIYAMLLAGLGLLGFAARRRKQQAA